MVKRHADGAVVAACASSCLDLLPSHHCAADQPILCSIENLPTSGAQEQAFKLPSNKKQCRLGADQGLPNPQADASSLFAQARALLRQPFCPSEAPIGREQEFETLTEAFEEFRNSSTAGSSIFVSGLPGTGECGVICARDQGGGHQHWQLHVLSGSVVLISLPSCAVCSSTACLRLLQHYMTPPCPLHLYPQHNPETAAVCPSVCLPALTGKSHTVRKSLTHLLSSSSSSAPQPQCLVTWVNCMSVSSAGEVYAQVAATARAGRSDNWQQHQGQHTQPQDSYHQDEDEAGQLPFEGQQQQLQQQQSMSFEALLECLRQPTQQPSTTQQLHTSSSTTSSSTRKRCRAARTSSSKASSKASSGSTPQVPAPHIVVLDEVDNIAKKSLPDLVQLFRLPHEPGVRLLLVGIANSIDLTERTLPELRLALVTPRLLTFNAYSAAQLGAILDAVAQQMPCRWGEGGGSVGGREGVCCGEREAGEGREECREILHDGVVLR